MPVSPIRSIVDKYSNAPYLLTCQESRHWRNQSWPRGYNLISKDANTRLAMVGRTNKICVLALGALLNWQETQIGMLSCNFEMLWKNRFASQLNHAMKWHMIKSVVPVKQLFLQWQKRLRPQNLSNILLSETWLNFLTRRNIDRDIGKIGLIQQLFMTCRSI